MKKKFSEKEKEYQIARETLKLFKEHSSPHPIIGIIEIEHVLKIIWAYEKAYNKALENFEKQFEKELDIGWFPGDCCD